MARLLVVDDEETYRKELSSILERKGHEVHTASKGLEAIEAGLSFHPQVLLVDWSLAGDLDGLHVAEALRQHNPDMQVIMITGYAAEDLQRQVTIPMTQVLEKPFGIDQLSAAVDRALTGAVGSA